MRPSFVTWLQAYALEQLAVGKAFRQRIGDWAFLDPMAEQVRYVTAIQGEDWQRLLKAGRDERRARGNSLKAIVRQEAAVASLWSRRPLAAKAARQVAAAVDPTNVQALRDQVETILVSEGMTPTEVADVLATLDGFTPEDVARGLDLSLKRMVTRLEDTVTRHQGAALGAVLAMAVARFNLASSAPPDLADPPDAYIGTVLPAVDELERELWRRLRSDDQFVVWGIARDLGELAGRRLLAGAVPHAAGLAKRRAADPDDPDLGRQALEIGNLVRRLLRAVALAMALEHATQWPADAPPYQVWVRLAERSRRSTSAWRWPQAATPAALANATSATDGKSRTVTGRVTGVSITHRNRKAISVVTVTNGGASIDAVLPYIKADSGGLVPGAWCRLAGVWRTASSETGGPALELDRQAFRELAKEGWYEAVTLGLAPLYTPVPHGLAAEWSWEPGVNGAGNQLRYGTWLSRRGG